MMTGEGYVANKPGTRIRRFDRPGNLRHIPHTRTVEDEKITRWALDRFHRLMGRDALFWAHPGESLGSMTIRGYNYFDLVDTGARIACLDSYGRESYRTGKWLEGLGKREESRGRKETAMNYYWRAPVMYAGATWGIFDSDSEELKMYRERINACYEKVCNFAPYPIERVEIPFEGKYMPAYLHMTPGREKAPTIVFAGGMDMYKEMYVNPSDNQFVKRGMNVLALDGPGQGESLERKIYHDTPDKYGKAGKTAIDWLIKRKEVDPNKIGVFGNSMGTYWASTIAIEDSRVRALAVGQSCYYPADGEIFNEVSPNFRSRWMWMSNKDTDDEWDEFVRGLTLEGKEHLVKCPLIIFAGELDHLCDIWLTYKFWKKTSSEIKELRIYADQYHSNFRFFDEMNLNMGPDWLRERLLNRPVEHPKHKVLFVNNRKEEKPVNIEALEKGFSYIESD